MSRSLNQELSSWKDVLARLRRTETTWRGISLSAVDHATFTEAILMNAMILHDLSNRYEGCGSKRDHISWALHCARVDVDSLAHFLPDAIALFRSDTTEGTLYASYADFKHRLAEKYPFAGNLLGPVSSAIDMHAACPSPATFYPVYQFLSYMTHLTLVDIDMSDELEDEYIATEAGLSRIGGVSHLEDQMNAVMTEWFRDFEVKSVDFVPKHGPGSIAELSGNTSIAEKYHLLRSDPLIDYVFRKHAGLEVRKDCFPLDLPGNTSREAAVVFVPKSMKTKRVISKEPATLQYLQQGLDRCIRKYMAEHPYLRQHIDLHDQSLQGELALEASRTKQYATVDLSAASDTVSYRLVKRVFRGTALYPYLVALRSRTVRLPSGKVMATAKYAPMGSALCFPIESLIFACVAECALRYARYENRTSMSKYRVYGDDIIVPDACLSDLVIYLRWCGFRINLGKTYGGNQRFRESCGCDAYDGEDVTCMRIGRSFSSRQVHPRSPSVFAGLISMANACYTYQFPLLRRYIVDKLVNDTGFVPLFSSDTDRGLYSPTPNNYRAPTRENRNWQCEEIRVAGIRSVHSPLGSLFWDSRRKTYKSGPAYDQAETIRYFEWLRLTYRREGDPHRPGFCPDVRVGNASAYLTKRWIVPRESTVDIPPARHLWMTQVGKFYDDSCDPS